MNHAWPSCVTLAICLTCAAVQLYWGGLDKQGQFHAEYLWANGNLGMSLFFLGPYVVLAASSLLAWRQRAAAAGLILIVLLCAIGLAAGWLDHAQYLRTPPGRETTPMLNFLATLILWPSSVVMLVAIGIARKAGSASPVRSVPLCNEVIR